MHNLKFLKKFILKNNKTYLLSIILLTLLNSAFDILSITALGPLIAIFINPDALISNKIFFYLIKVFQPDQDNYFQFIFIFFISMLTMSLIIRVLLLFVTLNFAKKIGAFFSKKILKNILYQNYEFIISKNINDYTSAITEKVDTSVSYIFNKIQYYISIVICLSIILFLSFSLTEIILPLISIVFLFYLVIGKLTKNYLNEVGNIVSKNLPFKYQLINETILNYKFLFVSNLQKIFIENFGKIDKKIRQALVNNGFISTLPRYFIEYVVVLTILAVAYFHKNQSDNNYELITSLGVVGFAILKTLPLIQGIYSSWTKIKSTKKIFEDIKFFLNLNTLNTKDKFKKLELKKNFSLNNMSFNYKDKNNQNIKIFEDVNINFLKGNNYAILGKTGEGKTTLISIILGLLNVNKDQFKVDEKNLSKEYLLQWKDNFSFVPQEISLIDDSISFNISFTNNPDEEKLKKVIELSCCKEFIDLLPNKLNTYVGSNGSKLSGGQRQRIGIARALYQNKLIYIFDEATSALDELTEKQVMKNLKEHLKEKTVFFISHKKIILEFVDKIIEVKNKKIFIKD